MAREGSASTAKAAEALLKINAAETNLFIMSPI
jgi:hypothetical protein